MGSEMCISAGLTSASPAALKAPRPATNATVWQRLENAGALCIAKTNMPELAAANSGYNPLHGHAWSPHGAGYSAGGSSSGTAAALAAGGGAGGGWRGEVGIGAG